MQIYNTLTERKESLDFLDGKKRLRLFVCGITPYDYPHIGNARTYVFFDTFVRYLRSRGMRVNYLQNVTDVDDRIIDRARREKISPIIFARRFERIYHHDERLLGIDTVTNYARASDHIAFIVKQIQTLIAKSHAYMIESDLPTGQAGGYYFNLATFPEYGKLARRTTAQAEDAVTRIDEGVSKKNKGDFALWKFPSTSSGQILTPLTTTKIKRRIIDGEPVWWTPLGWGRPGWHIEDTAITEHYFGPQYDVHGGALDLKFPHHEAEIAQQEAASGKAPLVKIWMHSGFLLVNGKKMSKSLGNFITVDNFLKRYSSTVFRYLVLSHHYRAPMDYNDGLTLQAKTTLANLQEFIKKITLVAKRGTQNTTRQETADLLTKLHNDFTTALEDDFNTPAALGTLFSFVHQMQERIFSLNRSEATLIRKNLQQLLNPLGLSLTPLQLPQRIAALIKKRNLARNSKNFLFSDKLRVHIHKLGYEVKDTPLGAITIKI